MLQRQTLIKLVLLILMLLLGLLTLSYLAVTFNLPVPATPDWLYNYQAKFKSKLKGDQLIGGGYFFMADGRDLWLRFRVETPLKEEQSISISNRCTPEELSTVSTWFLDNAVSQKHFLWVIPLPDNFAQDRSVLSQHLNLQCFTDGAITNRFGEVPSGCSSWSLYDRQTRYYYLRYACYN